MQVWKVTLKPKTCAVNRIVRKFHKSQASYQINFTHNVVKVDGEDRKKRAKK